MKLQKSTATTYEKGGNDKWRDDPQPYDYMAEFIRVRATPTIITHMRPEENEHKWRKMWVWAPAGGIARAETDIRLPGSRIRLTERDIEASLREAANRQMDSSWQETGGQIDGPASPGLVLRLLLMHITAARLICLCEWSDWRQCTPLALRYRRWLDEEGRMLNEWLIDWCNIPSSKVK